MIRWPAALLVGLLIAGCGKQPDPAQQDNSAGSPTKTASATAAASAEPTAEMGKMLFRRCAACHTIEAGGRNGIGPNLHGVVGRPLAAISGYSYSSAMKAKGGVWDEAALDRFLEQPMMAIPGSRMSFAGVIEPSERKALYLYLKAN